MPDDSQLPTDVIFTLLHIGRLEYWNPYPALIIHGIDRVEFEFHHRPLSDCIESFVPVNPIPKVTHLSTSVSHFTFPSM